MEEITRKFRTQFWQKQYAEMETTWLEMIAAGVAYAQLLELVMLTERQVPRETMASMLLLLADSLREKKRYADEYDVLRRLVAVSVDDTALARTIAVCVQRVYASVPDIEQLLHKSGLGYGQPLKEALPRLDRYLSFLPGTRVLDADRGPGRVKKLDLLLDKVTVDFDRGAELVWDLGAAQRVLRVCQPDGYFQALDRNRQALLDLAESRPGRVVALLLRDTGRAMSVRELEEGLSAVVSRERWEGFWHRARRELARDPHVVCRTGPARTFQWQDAPVVAGDRALSKAARRPRLEFGVDELAQKDRAGVLEAYAKLSTFPERRRFLDTLLSTRIEDGYELLEDIFAAARDGRVRALIEKELAGKRPERWQVLLEHTLTGYRQYPEAFLWLVEHFERLRVSDPKGIVTRILDLLESDVYKQHWTRFRTVLVDDEYRLVQRALGQIDESEAARLLGRVGRARTLDGYMADEIGQLAAARFPGLVREADDQVIYTTEPGLAKAKAELRRIMEQEIPRAADEIAQARAHGDLSENYEYKAAKEKQGRLLAKAKRLREEIARARIVSAADVDTSEVSVGCRVRMDDGSGHVVEYSILGPWDADLEQGTISYLSPFAQLLLGRKLGDGIEIDGRPYRIVNLSVGQRIGQGEGRGQVRT
ncbi:hypothetical protein FJY70_03485 [candidate division WOR-3 bacterium]|nr:hypothetical protein [candidate division WOR-3 bacterium]